MDIALVSLTLQTGDEERDAANVAVFSRLTHRCHALGIPVIGEYFPTSHAKLSPDQLHKNVLVGSRIVVELGADLVKTFYTRDFRAVTSTSPAPVLGLGAEKLPTQRDALRLAERASGRGGRRSRVRAKCHPSARCVPVPGGPVRRSQAERHRRRRRETTRVGVVFALEMTEDSYYSYRLIAPW